MMILYNILTLTALFLIILGFPVILSLILFSEKRKKTFLQRMAFIPLPEKVYKKRKKNRDMDTRPFFRRGCFCHTSCKSCET